MAMFVRRRWPYVAAAVVVAALVAVAIWLVAGRGGDEPQPVADPGDVRAYESELTPAASAPEGPETPTPIAVEAVLAAPDNELKTYADQPVAATSVTVLRRISPSVAWVGTDPANRVLLVLVAVENPFTFADGSKVTFTGTARRSAAGFGKQLGLTGAELADFERQGTYVEVETYTVG